MWHWEARHPSWTPRESGPDGWGPLVSSYAVDVEGRLLVFDPIDPPADAVELASARDTAIVLTCPWHERDARALAERLGVPLFVPPPDEGDPDPVPGTVFAAGERLPLGVRAFPGMEPNDLVLWIESRRALVVGDTLLDRGAGLEFPATWANKGVPPETILARLQPLLDLPVEIVLPTHGAPADRAALERALTVPGT